MIKQLFENWRHYINESNQLGDLLARARLGDDEILEALTRELIRRGYAGLISELVSAIQEEQEAREKVESTVGYLAALYKTQKKVDGILEKIKEEYGMIKEK